MQWQSYISTYMCSVLIRGRLVFATREAKPRPKRAGRETSTAYEGDTAAAGAARVEAVMMGACDVASSHLCGAATTEALLYHPSDLVGVRGDVGRQE